MLHSATNALTFSKNPQSANTTTVSDIQMALAGEQSLQVRRAVATVLKLDAVPDVLQLSFTQRIQLCTYVLQQGQQLSPNMIKWLMAVTPTRGLYEGTDVVMKSVAQMSGVNEIAYFQERIASMLVNSTFELKPSNNKNFTADYSKKIKPLIAICQEIWVFRNFDKQTRANAKLAQLVILEQDETLAREAITAIAGNIKGYETNQRSCTAAEALCYIAENTNSEQIRLYCIEILMQKKEKLLPLQAMQATSVIIRYGDRLIETEKAKIEKFSVYAQQDWQPFLFLPHEVPHTYSIGNVSTDGLAPYWRYPDPRRSLSEVRKIRYQERRQANEAYTWLNWAFKLLDIAEVFDKFGSTPNVDMFAIVLANNIQYIHEAQYIEKAFNEILHYIFVYGADEGASLDHSVFFAKLKDKGLFARFVYEGFVALKETTDEQKQYWLKLIYQNIDCFDAIEDAECLAKCVLQNTSLGSIPSCSEYVLSILSYLVTSLKGKILAEAGVILIAGLKLAKEKFDSYDGNMTLENLSKQAQHVAKGLKVFTAEQQAIIIEMLSSVYVPGSMSHASEIEDIVYDNIDLFSKNSDFLKRIIESWIGYAKALLVGPCWNVEKGLKVIRRLAVLYPYVDAKHQGEILEHFNKIFTNTEKLLSKKDKIHIQVKAEAVYQWLSLRLQQNEGPVLACLKQHQYSLNNLQREEQVSELTIWTLLLENSSNTVKIIGLINDIKAIELFVELLSYRFFRSFISERYKDRSGCDLEKLWGSILSILLEKQAQNKELDFGPIILNALSVCKTTNLGAVLTNVYSKLTHPEHKKYVANCLQHMCFANTEHASIARDLLSQHWHEISLLLPMSEIRVCYGLPSSMIDLAKQSEVALEEGVSKPLSKLNLK